MAAPPVVRKSRSWPSSLIKKLRAGRTQAEFGRLLGVPASAVRRWEAGRSKLELENAEKLSDLANKEDFLKDWNPVGSVIILDDLEEASQEFSEIVGKSLERTASETICL